MKGYIPIEIPTKKYIRAFIIAQLGEKPLMSTDHVVGNKLFDVLQRSTNEKKKDFSTKHYNSTIRVYISMHTFQHRGANLNETNVKRFNQFLQHLIKDRLRFLLDVYVPEQKGFEKALIKVRAVMNIGDEDWDSDSIKKDYYRYRLKKSLPLLYQKKSEKDLPQMSLLENS